MKNTQKIIAMLVLVAMVASGFSLLPTTQSKKSMPEGIMAVPNNSLENTGYLHTDGIDCASVEEPVPELYMEPTVDVSYAEISNELTDSAYEGITGIGGAPDLVVKSISVSPSDPTAYQTITIYATIINYGDVTASGFSVEFKSQYGTANISLGTVWVDNLEPEASTTVYKTTNKLGPGYHIINVVADSANGIPESNEKNNVKSMTQWFKAPDLVVESTWIVDTYGSTTTTITSGQPFKVYTKVKNAGDASTSATFYTKLYVDGQLYGTKTTSGLSVGSSFSFYASVPYVSEVGSHTVRVVVDTTYTVSEANTATGTYIGTGESNNAPTITFQVVKAKWTVLMYYDGDNNLDDYMIDDFNDIASVGSTRDVSIAVQIDHASSGAYRYFVTKGLSPTAQNAVASLGEVNMGDRDTFIGFLVWGAQRFQAEHYLVNPENHGGAWLGCCWDDTNGDDNLDLTEIANGAQALKQLTGHNVDVLYFDDCLMGSIEVLAQIYPYVDYAVASETIGWTSTFPQDRIVGAIVSNPGISSASLATTIINVATPVDDGSHMTQAIAAYQMSAVPSLVSSVNNFANALISALATDRANISKARNYTQAYEGPYGGIYEMVDLYNFAENAQKYSNSSAVKSAAADVMSKVGSIVMTYRATASVSFCHGIGIYFPKGSSSLIGSYSSSGVFTQQTQWDEFLQQFNSKLMPPTVIPQYSPMAIETRKTLF